MQVVLRALLVIVITFPLWPRRAAAWPQGATRHGEVTADILQRIHGPTVIYDLNYLRLYPAALSNKRVMQYFIGLNNCNDADVERAMLNELDYPALADWYSANAPRILGALPRALTDIAYRKGTVLALGEYNAQRRSFPFRFPGRNAVDLPDSLSFGPNRVSLRPACPVAASAAARAANELPFEYRVSIRPASFTELPMAEADARKYIESIGAQNRNIFLSLDVRILSAAPHFTRLGGAASRAAFNGEIARMRVIDARTQQPIGILIDDNSVSAPNSSTPAPPAPKLPKADPAAGLAANDLVYEIRANVQAFLDRKASSNYFHDRYQYDLGTGSLRQRVAANGRENFGSDSSERMECSKIAAKIAPLGSFAPPVK